MTTPEKQPIPVLIGADLNCYHVARAFHEAYGVCSYAFGHYETGAIKKSRLIRFVREEKIDTDEVFEQTMLAFAKEHAGQGPMILLGCTDDYANLIARHKEALRPYFLIPYNDAALMDELQSKSRFYRLCEQRGIPYPKTVILSLTSKRDESVFSPDALGFSYPIIVKPANSVRYWKHPFEGMNKVYEAKTPKEAAKIVDTIYQSGYDDDVILQDFIIGNNSAMHVLTTYSQSDGKVKMMRLGHVLLEEQTPKGRGNHTAILTENNPALTEPFRALLEELGYVGFANFDIKYDARDGSYRAFEINLRQGRSNFYCTASGANIAKCLVEDLVEQKDAPSNDTAEEIFWSYIPRAVLYRYMHNDTLRSRAKALCRKGRFVSSFWYRPDLRRNPARLFYVLAQQFNQFRKFHKYRALCK